MKVISSSLCNIMTKLIRFSETKNGLFFEVWIIFTNTSESIFSKQLGHYTLVLQNDVPWQNYVVSFSPNYLFF